MKLIVWKGFNPDSLASFTKDNVQLLKIKKIAAMIPDIIAGCLTFLSIFSDPFLVKKYIATIRPAVTK